MSPGLESGVKGHNTNEKYLTGKPRPVGRGASLIFAGILVFSQLIHGQVGWMPRLPAAGAGRAETDPRTGVKADPIIIFSFPGSPSRVRGELHSLLLTVY